MKKQFNIRASGMNGTDAMFITGILGIVFGALLIFIGSPASGLLIGIGIMYLLMARWTKKRTALGFNDDHIEMKLAPLRSQIFVLYRDIAKVEKPNARKIILVTTSGEKISIPMNLFEPNDQQLICDLLNEKTGEGIA